MQTFEVLLSRNLSIADPLPLLPGLPINAANSIIDRRVSACEKEECKMGEGGGRRRHSLDRVFKPPHLIRRNGGVRCVW